MCLYHGNRLLDWAIILYNFCLATTQNGTLPRMFGPTTKGLSVALRQIIVQSTSTVPSINMRRTSLHPKSSISTNLKPCDSPKMHGTRWIQQQSGTAGARPKLHPTPTHLHRSE